MPRKKKATLARRESVSRARVVRWTTRSSDRVDEEGNTEHVDVPDGHEKEWYGSRSNSDEEGSDEGDSFFFQDNDDGKSLESESGTESEEGNATEDEDVHAKDLLDTLETRTKLAGKRDKVTFTQLIELWRPTPKWTQAKRGMLIAQLIAENGISIDFVSCEYGNEGQTRKNTYLLPGQLSPEIKNGEKKICLHC